MHKLILKFNRERNEHNARKLLDYLEKHPMATCTASSCDMSIIKIARELLEG